MNMIVAVKQGQLEGFTKKSILNGDEYCCFLGIPYAKPPVGNLRFRPPEPAEKWNGVRSAKDDGSLCIQKNFITGEILGSEDCLYLNIYMPTPPAKNKALKAVMVFIHGGAFLEGSGTSDLYSPDYLMNYDIILVTINYRLHVLGFMDLGTESTAGNCGLRDQNLALKWINENIKQFGGDPTNITIFGESAGATSIYYHLISPMSKADPANVVLPKVIFSANDYNGITYALIRISHQGVSRRFTYVGGNQGLFNKAIVQSDPIYSLLKNGSNAQNLGHILAKKLGNDEEDKDKLVEFLRKQSAHDICKQSSFIWEEIIKNQDKMFGPSVEINKTNAFLPDKIENLKKAATPVPLIIGLTNKEGRLIHSYSNLWEKLSNDFTSIIRRDQKYNLSEFQVICSQLKKYYVGDKPVGEATAEEFADLFTDYWFREFYESIDFITSSASPVYIYEFCFHGKFNVFETLIMKNLPKQNSGACHGDDLPYLFNIPKLLPQIKQFEEPEVTVIKNMCSLWTNFAKYGNPSENFNGVEWRQFSLANPCFLRIDADLKLIEEKLRREQFEFWSQLLF